jgi:hypothetical protein
MVPGDGDLLGGGQGGFVIDLTQEEGAETNEDELDVGILEHFLDSGGVVEVLAGDAA